MNKKKLANLKSKLCETRERLSGGVKKALQDSKDEVKGGVPDISDEASRTYARQVILNLGEKEREELRLVEVALSKMEENKYGICDSCEGKIPEGRLEAVPYTRYCVQCQNKKEV
jgi:DnaK suppressor protein